MRLYLYLAAAGASLVAVLFVWRAEEALAAGEHRLAAVEAAFAGAAVMGVGAVLVVQLACRRAPAVTVRVAVVTDDRGAVVAVFADRPCVLVTVGPGTPGAPPPRAAAAGCRYAVY